ncbi:hypothetical protein C5S31_06600 [ANME-1 cluster archaeon GoMg2]|nr:hypothetical protein [ANME-1 cluster archaeon GoMg2]
MPKIKKIIAIVVLMAAVTVCICSSGNAQNYDGTWVGNTSYNGDVEFNVSGNNITTFSISVEGAPVDRFDKSTGMKVGNVISNTKFRCNVFNTSIVNSGFNYTSASPVEENIISGCFSSINEAGGTWKHEHEDLWGSVLVYPLITWSATRVGASTSAITIIKILPTQKTVNQGESFTVDILVTPNQPITEIKLDLCVDPSLITVKDVKGGEMFPPDNFGSNKFDDGVTIFGISIGGTISTPGIFATVHMTADSKNTGTSTLHFSNVKVEGSEGEVISAVNDGSVTVGQPPVFDTGYGTYPSIAGMHTGTIKPTQDIIVYELYTYSCPGTGGHSESVRIWNDTEIVADWHGYNGDWHSIQSSPHFLLLAGQTYHYCIRTGSYPQIIHEPSLTNEYGTITCEEFVDVNGRSYDDWIPAFRLAGEFMDLEE